MSRWNVVDTVKCPITVRGVELTATIEVATQPDDTDPAGDFDFGDADENAEYLARFHSGEIEMTLIRVRAMWNGVEGSDYLGSCHTLASNFGSDVVSTAREYGMADNAVADLIREIESVQLAK